MDQCRASDVGAQPYSSREACVCFLLRISKPARKEVAVACMQFDGPRRLCTYIGLSWPRTDYNLNSVQFM